MREDDIMYENGEYWVARDRNCYTVMKNGNVSAVSDSGYAKTPDGLSIAIARVDYLARRA